MTTEITMPKLSDTMEEGTILKWHVTPGQEVSRGEIIAEVETDKAAMEMEAYENGTVSELKVEEGETVAVGTVIAVLDGGGKTREGKEEKRQEPEEAERKTAPEGKKEAERKTEPEAKKEAGREEGQEKQETRPRAKSEAPKGEIGEEEEEAVRARPPRRGAGRVVPASPAARKVAEREGIDLERVRGTGPGGRVTEGDVERTLAEGGDKVRRGGRRAGRRPSAKAEGERSVKIRRIVARKMVESWQNAPHFFVTVAVDMTDVIRFRKDLKVSINDFIVAAASRCLQDHPWVNSLWGDGQAIEQGEINIAIAVATDRGLYNPVLKHCSHLSLREISRQSKDLTDRAHAGKLRQEDLEGGTFTISNMGMLGVESFSAIITPPQAAVLAVGTVKGEVVVDDREKPGIAPIVRLTLSADHRMLDGADAAEFLTSMKSYLEAPVVLLTADDNQE